jgi:hypothetical protein
MLGLCGCATDAPSYGGETYYLSPSQVAYYTAAERRGNDDAGRKLYLYYALFVRDARDAARYKRYLPPSN